MTYIACLQITVCLTKVNKTEEYKPENPTVMQSSKCPNIQKRKALSDLVATYGKESKLLIHISQVPTLKPKVTIRKLLSYKAQN